MPDTEVIIERGSTARDLGPKLNRSAGDVIRFLLLQGEMVTATQSLTDDMIDLFAAELGAEVRLVDPGEEREAELLAKFFDDDDEEEDEADLRPRPPVVTVMGHVDHGKTLLLDRIRSANVVAGEAGGITQHIGAYQVDWNGHPITFIDTPGHEAFTAMRARGAEVTDIVVLVVAADDGVMPQTIEAIDHAKAADVPIVVAVNKIDREEADPNRVLQQLSEHGLVPEAWGGDTITVEISALQNLGIEDLLEQIILVAEVEELVASPEGRARGVVLEAELEIGRGPVASVIVERGTLRVGDPIVAGAAWGKVKALVDDHGEQIKEAPPSTPVQVLGFSEPPEAGDEFRVAPELAQARTIGEARAHRYRVAGHVPAATSALGGAKLEDLFEQIQRGETATLNLILKADVRGSLEAVTESLRKLEREDVKLSFVHRGVGGITESDVELAQASAATMIGFNVRPDRRAREMAAKVGVEIRLYEIIYKLLEDLEAAMLGLLSPVYEEIVTGEAEVRQVFRVPRIGAIAGCYVREGVITRGSKVRFLRDGAIIWKGAITSLRRFKDDAREVSGRLRVRDRALRLPGPQRGRHHRDLRRAGDPPDLVAGVARPRAAPSRATGGSRGPVSARRNDNRGVAPYARSLRVNQVLRQVLAEEIERLADADERLRLVTVTSVDTAPDLRHATVYLSSLTDDSTVALGERRAQLQRALGRQVRMKRTPQLEFAVDPAVVAGGRVEDVLRRIRDSEAAPGAGGGPDGPDGSEP